MRTKHLKRLSNGKSRLGRLIVFEGPDETGKTTVSRHLAQYLAKSGRPCIWLAFPGHEPDSLGAEIYALHHDARFLKVPPVSVQLLHVAAHIESIHQQIIPALVQGISVVLDRYWWSTWVYGVASAADPVELDLALKIEQRHWNGIRPSLAFLFERKGGTSSKRVRLQELYRKIARRECENHPIRVVKNDKMLAETLIEVKAAADEVCSTRQ